MEFVKQSSRLRRLCTAVTAAAMLAAAPAAHADVEEVVERLAALGFPVGGSGGLTNDGTITLASGLTFMVAQTGEVAVLDENGNLIMAGAIEVITNPDKGAVEIDIVTEAGGMTLTVFARADSDVGVVFEGAAIIGSTSYTVTPGWLDVDLAVSVNPISGECGCLTQLPPITPDGPPRRYKGSGCTRSDCRVQNPCEFRVRPRQSIIIDGESLEGGRNAAASLSPSEALVALGGLAMQAEDQFPPPGVYEGTCHEEGSEVVALAFLLLAGLGVIWMRRSPVPA